MSVPDPSLDDVRDVLESLSEVLQPVVAESDVVGEVSVVPDQLLGGGVLGQGLAVSALLVEKTCWGQIVLHTVDQLDCSHRG